MKQNKKESCRTSCNSWNTNLNKKSKINNKKKLICKLVLSRISSNNNYNYSNN